MENEIVKRENNEITAKSNDNKLERFDNNFSMQELLQTAGTLDIDKKKLDILRAPVKDEDISIRPDGLIYLSWIEYQKRLDAVFGTKWALVPNGMPTFERESNLILWGFTLICDGKFVDFAIGQQEYKPTNRMMTYGDAMEGAKSNALMRCCKRLGIGLELWDREFIEKWKKKHAYISDGKWYKRQAPSFKKGNGNIKGVISKFSVNGNIINILINEQYIYKADVSHKEFIEKHIGKEVEIKSDSDVVSEIIS